MANDPLRFTSQIGVVTKAAGLERHRLLQWLLAFAGLSAAWFAEDGDIYAVDGQLQSASLSASMLEA
ncbi:aminoglycoside phosphotransferase family protein [Rhodococcus sp. IEGM1300]